MAIIQSILIKHFVKPFIYVLTTQREKAFKKTLCEKDMKKGYWCMAYFFSRNDSGQSI